MNAPWPISVLNQQRGSRLALKPLREFSARALQLCLDLPASKASDLTRLKRVMVVLVSKRRMTALHEKFMNMGGSTDVITFQHGEIFIGVETARENAERFNTSLEHELCLYVVHGLLHLHGFDDTTPKKARVMKRMQSQILASAWQVGSGYLGLGLN